MDSVLSQHSVVNSDNEVILPFPYDICGGEFYCCPDTLRFVHRPYLNYMKHQEVKVV